MRLPTMTFLVLASVAYWPILGAESPTYGPPPTPTPPSTRPAWKTVAPDEFEKLAGQPDSVILDVRTAKEFKVGHIRNAVNVDLNAKDFDKTIAQLDKSKTYLVYCRTGNRSTTALSRMTEAGFRNLVHLEGGIGAWRAARKPLVE